MAGEFSDQRLEAVLISIGHHLETPPEPTVASRGQDHGRKRTSLLLVAAAVIVIVVAGIVLVPSTRTAIADLFGIGSTRIKIGGEPPVDETELPHIAEGLAPVSVDEATTILGGDLPDTGRTSLGPPEAIYRMPEGGVLLAWRDDTATLWIRTAVDTSIDSGIVVRKLIDSGESVEIVNDLGTEALLIDGSHLFQTPQRRVAAQRVLLWYDDGYEYRLEADMVPARLTDIARGIR